MSPMEWVYGLAIGVLVVIAMAAALHPGIPTGIVGTTLIGGIVLCQLAAVERWGETPNWRALLTILEAGLAAWAMVRWIVGRSR